MEMEKKKERTVKLVELHTKVHTKKGTKPGEPRSSGILEFVDPMSKQRFDEYSKIISEKHVENKENTDIDENGSKSPPDEFEVWKGVATSNRGHVLGVGLTIDLAFVLIDEKEAVEAHRVVDQLALHKTLNDRLESFAKNYPPRATESDPGPS
ncbi:transposase, Ptta/En/Spm [Tanacetum coccineum]